MKGYLIAERYARGLSVSIPDNEDLEPLAQALQEVADLYGESHDLRSVLSNPAIDLHRRIEVLEGVGKGMEVPSVVLRLVELLVRRGRITLLADVADVFSELADQRLNRVTAEVLSAAPLDESQQDRVKVALQKHTDKEVRLDCSQDQSLLGGVRARVGDRVFDGSLRTRLRNMKDMLLAES